MHDSESLNFCLVECVKAAGGSKVMGGKLWPEKTVDAAQRHLLNCLQEGRAERLTPEQVLYIAAQARDAGCHAYMAFCAQRLHYAPPLPREPQQELAELQRAFVEAVAQQARMADQIQKLMAQVPGSQGLKAVA